MTTREKADEISTRLRPILKPLGWWMAIGHPGKGHEIWTITLFDHLDGGTAKNVRKWVGLEELEVEVIVAEALRSFLS
jgi:hypothetical protein